MNSRDPWAVIVTDEAGSILIPEPRYGHPLYTEVPSWIHYGDPVLDGTTRQLFDGAFISGDTLELDSGLRNDRERDDRRTFRSQTLRCHTPLRISYTLRALT